MFDSFNLAESKPLENQLTRTEVDGFLREREANLVDVEALTRIAFPSLEPSTLSRFSRSCFALQSREPEPAVGLRLSIVQRAFIGRWR